MRTTRRFRDAVRPRMLSRTALLSARRWRRGVMRRERVTCGEVVALWEDTFPRFTHAFSLVIPFFPTRPEEARSAAVSWRVAASRDGKYSIASTAARLSLNFVPSLFSPLSNSYTSDIFMNSSERRNLFVGSLVFLRYIS